MPLWKRCRILANPLRVEMLVCLEKKEPQCVKDIAEEVGVLEDVSSKNLQMLESGGFLQRKRVGKYLLYSLNRTDGLLQAVLGDAVVDNPDFGKILHMLTALTHERRILIVSALAKGQQEFGLLCRQTGISWRAMERQLDKLVRRGFVLMNDGCCRLVEQESLFGNTLIGEAVNAGTPAQVCQSERESTDEEFD